jgi:hypothetical protein
MKPRVTLQVSGLRIRTHVSKTLCTVGLGTTLNKNGCTKSYKFNMLFRESDGVDQLCCRGGHR